MDPTPWIERWRTGRIGFHRDDVHPRLREHWPTLGLRGNEAVYVPLCGKSLDMRWLAGLGHRVRGVELSEIAALDFFAEWGKRAHVESRDGFLVHAAAGVEIWVGDVLDLRPEHLLDVEAFYDRAAIVALDREDRAVYARHLASVLPAGARGLLVGLDSDEDASTGPPFRVPESEIASLLDRAFERELLVHDARVDDARARDVRERGPLVEHVHRLVRRAA